MFARDDLTFGSTNRFLFHLIVSRAVLLIANRSALRTLFTGQRNHVLASLTKRASKEEVGELDSLGSR